MTWSILPPLKPSQVRRREAGSGFRLAPRGARAGRILADVRPDFVERDHKNCAPCTEIET
jgi:hypothetical protein